MNKNTIFTFWENDPRNYQIKNSKTNQTNDSLKSSQNDMPAYIKMCMKSWKKHLPNYEIIVLNYANLSDYIGVNFYDKILFEKFTLAQQTHAIRAAVLEKHGGIWFDADIILTSGDIEKFFDEHSQCNIFENRIACIKAKKHAKILKKWVRGIKLNLFKYKYLFDFYFRYYPYKTKDMLTWSYLSEQILHSLFKIKNKKILNNISIAESKTYPEILWDREFNRRRFEKVPVEGYNHFYINNDFSEYARQNNNGMIILHNSWMPREYQVLSKDEILKRGNTLSKLFAEIDKNSFAE